ncbi:Carbohydrate esterase family 16 protein [Mycena sanguinolenta]|uniref:Carbohydrate esterase family 16 protein n=1 Tax=Mycena sanguinolenta TaxID=230812 RepID=A0A8H6XV11_9AGAR|nr:Carbohydrate esterase family 16 protein [Mycena sanguinolenta]
MTFIRSLPVIALAVSIVQAQSPVYGHSSVFDRLDGTDVLCFWRYLHVPEPIQCVPSSATGTTTTISTTTTTTSTPPVSSGKVTYWFPFGDSYTTTGFDPNSTLPTVGNPLGNPPFPGFTGAGGENFVGFDTVTYNKSIILTYNYAYGGATIDANLVVPYLPTVLSLTDQVNEFLEGVAKKPATAPWTSTNALFTIWIGINDIGNSYYESGDRDAFSDTLLAAYFALVQKLIKLVETFISFVMQYGAGARNFLFINVPPIDRSPLMLAQPASAQALEKTVIAGFNTKLAAQITSFKANNPGVTTWLWDSNTAFTTILNNPTKYGFVDAVSYGNTGDFWGNNYHPGTPAHQIFAQQISTLLAGTPWF